MSFCTNTIFDSIDVTRIERRLDDLSEIGRTSEGGVTRLAYSEEENEAFEYVLDELPDSYVIEKDALGNVFASRSPHSEPTVLTGSHLDSVFNGGYLDGTLGVVASLEAIDALYASDIRVNVPPTLAIFRGEESSRFGHHTIGSQAALGMLDSEVLAASDQNGIPLWRAIEEAGFRPANLSAPSFELDHVEAFLELHIEQGRVLESGGDDVGVVSSIRAPVRYECTIYGNYDHSGATPMELRQDALAAAGEMIVSVEEIAAAAAEEGDLVGTVGDVTAVDGAINQVSGEVTFPLDLRSDDADYLAQVETHVIEALERIADRRNVQFEATLIDRTDPAELDSSVISLLEDAASEVGTSYQVLPSGGGHDAMNFKLKGIPTGMLFVPSIDGISHNPEEETTRTAITDATRTLASALAELQRTTA